MQSQDPDNLVMVEQTVGKLTFVDLAGSERLKKSQARSGPVLWRRGGRAGWSFANAEASG